MPKIKNGDWRRRVEGAVFGLFIGAVAFLGRDYWNSRIDTASQMASQAIINKTSDEKFQYILDWLKRIDRKLDSIGGRSHGQLEKEPLAGGVSRSSTPSESTP